VLELSDPPELAALYERCQARAVVAEELTSRPWGLTDFRLADPDGYYIRVTSTQPV
jgi:hypothetical protein